jgi:hypothetical protein
VNAPALTLLWRGPLDACNYACGYCPFAKRAVRPAMLAADRAALHRFVAWVEAGNVPALDLLFTPWGEALVHAHYRAALVRLSHNAHVGRVAAQTNGAALGAWLARADPRRLGFWISYHPSQTTRAAFVRRVLAAHERGFRLSVGGVASAPTMAAFEDLRAALPVAIPMWLNPLRPGPPPDAALAARCRAIDPWFPFSRTHRSRGRACSTGFDAIAVDGDGDIRRCHFVDTVLGNIYARGWQDALRRRSCPRAGCDCFIGYVHLDHLGLRAAFAGGVIERIPAAGACAGA